MAITQLGFTDGAEVSLKVGGTEYNMELKNARFENQDGEAKFVTFASSAAGDGLWKFIATAFQSFRTASFWSFVDSNAGGPAEITLTPYGNAVPTEDEPHFVATATIARRPNIGGAAKSEFDFEVEWELVDPPVKVTAPTTGG